MIFGPIVVKLLFQQSINRIVQIKRKTWHTAHTKPTIYIETAWTLQEKINLGTAQFKRLMALWVKDISSAFWIVEFRHYKSLHDERLSFDPAQDDVTLSGVEVL